MKYAILEIFTGVSPNAFGYYIAVLCIMVRGRIKGYRQCYKSFVTRLTTGCDTVM